MFSQNLSQNIMHWLSEASDDEKREGKSWYPRAKEECRASASSLSVDPELFTATVAALSPRMNWDKNVEAAESLIKHGVDYPTPAYIRNRIIAHNIFSTGDLDLLKGAKTRPFFRTIMDNRHEVPVLDSWAMRACGVFAINRKLRVAERPLLVAAYRDVAEKTGHLVSEVQAIAWVTIRNRWAIKEGERSLVKQR